MSIWIWAALLAVTLTGGGALYIRLRGRLSPQAYRAMLGLAVGYLAAGALTAAIALHLLASIAAQDAPVPSPPGQTSVASPSAAVGDLLPLKFTGKIVGVT